MTYSAVLDLVMRLIALPLVVLVRFPFVLGVLALLLVMGALAVLCCVKIGSVVFFSDKRL